MPAEVDTALIVSVDVSNSVDEHRYRLQMEGIAKALEDPEVLKAILNGPQGGILIAMVTWADKPRLSLPWQRIANAVRCCRRRGQGEGDAAPDRRVHVRLGDAAFDLGQGCSADPGQGAAHHRRRIG